MGPEGGFSLERGEAITRLNEYSLIEQFLIFLPGPLTEILDKVHLVLFIREVVQAFDFF